MTAASSSSATLSLEVGGSTTKGDLRETKAYIMLNISISMFVLRNNGRVLDEVERN